MSNSNWGVIHQESTCQDLQSDLILGSQKVTLKFLVVVLFLIPVSCSFGLVPRVPPGMESEDWLHRTTTCEVFGAEKTASYCHTLGIHIPSQEVLGI